MTEVVAIHPANSWVVEVQHDPATGDAILQLPEDLLQNHDWRGGDVLSYEVQDTGGDGPEHPAFTLVNLSRNLQKQAAKEAAEQDTSPEIQFNTSNSSKSFKSSDAIHPAHPGTLEKPPSGESAPPVPSTPPIGALKLFLVDTVVIHRHRYAIRALSQEHALDTVVCREAEAFSKEVIDESIFSAREVSDEQFLQAPEIAEKTRLINPHAANVANVAHEVSEQFIHTVDYSDLGDHCKPAKASEF